jgi:BMFP domain-containing protein YqiC
MVQAQRETLGILETANSSGRHEVALKAIREVRENAQVIAKLQAQSEGTLNSLDLCRLSPEEFNFLLRNMLGGLPTREREQILLSTPDLAPLMAE